MLACRFVLGITEAPFYPGGVFLISQFYTRKESATRLSVFYTGNLLASSFSGLISAGVFAGMEGKHGLAGWRWLFIIQGSVTGESLGSSNLPATDIPQVGVAILAYFMLPNAPLETRWLTQEERELAHSRILFDTTGKKEKQSLWKGLAEACLDYRTWVFALLQNSHLSANSFKNFLPTVVKVGVPLFDLSIGCADYYPDTRLQPHHHASAYVSAVPALCFHLYCCRMVIWTVQRAYLAYHRVQSRRHHRFHHRYHDAERRRSILCHGVVRRYDLRR